MVRIVVTGDVGRAVDQQETIGDFQGQALDTDQGGRIHRGLEAHIAGPVTGGQVGRGRDGQLEVDILDHQTNGVVGHDDVALAQGAVPVRIGCVAIHLAIGVEGRAVDAGEEGCIVDFEGQDVGIDQDPAGNTFTVGCRIAVRVNRTHGQLHDRIIPADNAMAEDIEGQLAVRAYRDLLIDRHQEFKARAYGYRIPIHLFSRAVDPVEFQVGVPNVQVNDGFDAHQVGDQAIGEEAGIGNRSVLEDDHVHGAHGPMQAKRAVHNTVVAVIIRRVVCDRSFIFEMGIRQLSGPADVKLEVVKGNLEDIGPVEGNNIVAGRLRVDSITAARIADIEHEAGIRARSRRLGHENAIEGAKRHVSFDVQADFRRDVEHGRDHPFGDHQGVPVKPFRPAADLVDFDFAVPDVQFTVRDTNSFSSEAGGENAAVGLGARIDRIEVEGLQAT